LKQKALSGDDVIGAIAVKTIDESELRAATSRRRKRKRNLILMLIVFVVIVAVTIAVVLTANNGDTESSKNLSPGSTALPSLSPSNIPTLSPTRSPSAAPNTSSNVVELVDRLSSQYPDLDRETMLTDGTAQNLAVTWLALDDEWMTTEGEDGTSSNSDASIEMIAERYALAVLYYTANNTEWLFEWDEPMTRFLDPVSVCEWNTENIEFISSEAYCGVSGVVVNYEADANTRAGVFCNEDGSVVDLDLCEYILQLDSYDDPPAW